MKSAVPLVGTPKAVWLARNFVWWSRWEGEGKGLVGTYFFVVRVRVRIRVKVRVRVRVCPVYLETITSLTESACRAGARG